MVQICKQCLLEFNPSRHGQLFCSPSCKSKNYYNNHKEEVVERSRLYRKNNPDKHRQAVDNWNKNNSERRTANVVKWQKENPDKLKVIKDRERIKNIDRYKEYSKEYYQVNKEKILNHFKKWRKENKDKTCFYSNRYKARKIMATAGWANFDKIMAIYQECSLLTSRTGVKHHVDHIIPLKNNIVCGLHVENNLQILTMKENLSKHNKFEPVSI